MKRYIIVGWSSCQNWNKSADKGQTANDCCPVKYSQVPKKSVSHKGGCQNHEHCQSVKSANNFMFTVPFGKTKTSVPSKRAKIKL